MQRYVSRSSTVSKEISDPDKLSQETDVHLLYKEYTRSSAASGIHFLVWRGMSALFVQMFALVVSCRHF